MDNKELQTRRDFFKKAATAALPVVGAIALSQVPLVSKAHESQAAMGCDYGCSGSCSGSCSGDCRGSCSIGCERACMGSCKGGCQQSCDGGCMGDCYGSCRNNSYSTSTW